LARKRGQLMMETLEPRHLLTAFSPGGDGTVGVLTDPLVMQPADTLRIDLGGAAANQFDRVQIAEAAKFDGKLSVHLVNKFDPVVGTSFQIVNSVGTSGAFAELELPENLAGGKRLVPVITPDGLTLVVADPQRPAGNSLLATNRNVP
jgi:hypothetical protein